jgi:hypothetical protein
MKDLILGSHLLFAREGETIDSVLVSATARPDTDPTTNYIKFPTVEDWEPKFTQQFATRRSPSPGRYQTRKKIPLSSTMTHAFSLQEFTKTTLAELVLGGGVPNSSTGIFVPGSRADSLRGWWIIQAYDQNQSPIIVLNIWGEATIEGYKFGERLDPYALVIEQLYSPLTTGTITNLTD